MKSSCMCESWVDVCGCRRVVDRRNLQNYHRFSPSALLLCKRLTTVIIIVVCICMCDALIHVSLLVAFSLGILCWCRSSFCSLCSAPCRAKWHQISRHCCRVWNYMMISILQDFFFPSTHIQSLQRHFKRSTIHSTRLFKKSPLQS